MIIFLPKKSSTTSPTNTNVEYKKRRIRIEANKIDDLVLGNNRTFDWKVP